MSENRRRFSRVPLIAILWRGDCALGRTRDLGLGGVYVVLAAQFHQQGAPAAGESIVVQFELPDGGSAVRVFGRVVRTDRDPSSGAAKGLAIEFGELTEVIREGIQHYISQVPDAEEPERR